MASRGFLIRFIDIGLIVLFGFLMISDIDAASHVELADTLGDAPETETEDEEERGVILVDIGPTGTYTISEPRPQGGDETVDEVSNEGASTEDVPPDETGTPARLPDIVSVAGVAALTTELRLRASRNESAALETLVVIQPHPASFVQFTVDVMDVCDRLSLPKSLRMDIEVAPPPDSLSPGRP
jgi:hypothetical protein